MLQKVAARNKVKLPEFSLVLKKEVFRTRHEERRKRKREKRGEERGEERKR